MPIKQLQFSKETLKEFLTETIQIGSCKGSSIRYKKSDDTYWSLYLFSAIKLNKKEIQSLNISLQK